MRNLIISLILLLGASAARAQTPVDIELVLAVDVSYSMDATEQVLQRGGYAGAFRDHAVINAMLGGRIGKIAVTYFEWAGPQSQKTVIPWTLIDSEDAAFAFAKQLDEAPIGRERRTSISGGLIYAGQQFGHGFKGTRRVIDVSGDGPNNAGVPLVPERDRLVKSGIVINGLPIVLYRGGTRGYFDIDNLDAYYAQCVIGGEGSFVVAIRSAEQFAPATRQKMLQEIAGLAPPARLVRTQLSKAPEPVDCQVGEKQMQRFEGR